MKKAVAPCDTGNGGAIDFRWADHWRYDPESPVRGPLLERRGGESVDYQRRKRSRHG